MIPFCNSSSTGSHEREREVELIGVMEKNWGGPPGAGVRERESEREGGRREKREKKRTEKRIA